jgi:cell division protein FtsI/penicillin-binding protein 2
MNPSYNKEPAIENRTMVLVWTVVVVLAIFFIRLLTVQILDHKYHELAQQNAIRRVNA